MEIKQRLNALRNKMKEQQLDAYIILGTDPHMSEYIPHHWQARQWLSGFTGSFGNMVVTQDSAGLWTDSRYFIQAEKQLANTGIDLHKLRTEGYLDYPQWMASVLEKGSKVGIDSFNAGISDTEVLIDTLKQVDISLSTDVDLISEIWSDRPLIPIEQFSSHSTKYSGASRTEKIESIRKEMKAQGANYHLVASLDDIAWIMNIRGNDVDYNPVVISYLLISQSETILFTHKSKLSEDVESELVRDDIKIKEYNDIENHLSGIKDADCFLIDPNRLNYNLYKIINLKHKVIKAENPSVLMKSIKNSTEIEGMRQACIKDGVALTKFWCWLEKNKSDKHTELSLEKELRKYRAEQVAFMGESFHSIVAYKENAALPHYSASADMFSEIQEKGLLLIDSGAQYKNGTTDITRTMPMGPLSQEERDDYTLVLRGMINLSRIKFPKGTRGCNIDFAARQALWEAGLDYGHGTGHGVGSFLNVHEGPQSIRQELKDQAVLEGMITSNEPGCYKEGRHGIRHENLILCTEDQKTEFGTFLKFETMTLCYFDTSALNIKLMKNEEIEWLNNYHEKVYKTLAPSLDQEHCDWLKKKCLAI